MTPKRETLIFIPTYNERENVQELYSQIRAMGLGADILFLDDHSPDGTGHLIEELASRDASVKTIHRAGKQGVGSAHLEGIGWAYDHGYRTLITMDCDFTHQPADIPAFIQNASQADLVVGSRFMEKTSLKDWNLPRKALTHLGHFLTKWLLNVPQDATGAFRLYRLDRIPRRVFDGVRSVGYSFFFESLCILGLNGVRIKELPIDLPKRTYGHSKMTFGDSWNSLKRLFSMYRRIHADKKSLMVTDPPAAPSDAGAREEWDAYWAKKNGGGGKKVYDAIAEFYRRFVIRGTLNDFIHREFPADAELLHAGCGSGQVDEDIVHRMRVTALDISPAALELYRRTNGASARLVQGSVFRLPFNEASFDGVYNLGVMEHFTEDQIRQILSEFSRVLKPGGKAVLFWPPVYGLSVMALDLAHRVLNDVLKKNVKLHPDEITRVRSRKHAEAMLEESGFWLERYYFGPRDLFTHAVVVGQKKQRRAA